MVGPQELVASNLKELLGIFRLLESEDSAYWLAVDGFGNLFYSDQEAFRMA